MISPRARPCASSLQPRPHPLSHPSPVLRPVPSCSTYSGSVYGYGVSGGKRHEPIPDGLVLHALLRHRAIG
eukprot:scaffold110967_cov40-Tisochrysis_lutea.AAC.1